MTVCPLDSSALLTSCAHVLKGQQDRETQVRKRRAELLLPLWTRVSISRHSVTRFPRRVYFPGSWGGVEDTRLTACQGV